MTFCEAYGHKYEFWKMDGKTFFQCANCGDVKPITGGRIDA